MSYIKHAASADSFWPFDDGCDVATAAVASIFRKMIIQTEW